MSDSWGNQHRLDAVVELSADKDISEEDRLSYIQGIVRNAKELSKLIGDILDLSKVEADKLDLEVSKFSIFEIIDDVIETLKMRAQSRNTEITVIKDGNLSGDIHSDPIRFRQILVNLLGNAIKFTENGRVEIRVSKSEAAQSNEPFRLNFEISDSGIGLTPEQAKLLFEPFSQADSSTTRKFGGTGLGLALSKRLAQVIGGDLWLKRSEPERGSTFAFYISDLKDHEDLSSKPEIGSGKSENLQNLSILVVDDSIDIQIVIKHVLMRAGIKVHLASNGEEGVEKAFGSEFDLILMDIQMPKKDGFEATVELRRRGFTQPIIALTAHAMKEERERALRSGFDAYLTKPIEKHRLIETINELKR